jgi:hypothetical protein
MLMDNNEQTRGTPDATGNNDVNISRLNKVAGQDLQDSPQDEEKMKAETIIMDLPEVKDIPGQENVQVPNIQSMQDTTISSDDEEGAGIFDDDDEEDVNDSIIDDEEINDDDEELVMGNEADVTAEEATLLQRADEDMPTDDDIRLRRAELDETDNDGDALNESSVVDEVAGGDLDVSGADSDDPMESIGEEDEENNYYSLGSDSNDNITEGTP